MTKRKKILWVVTLVLILLGAGFYYLYFVSTNAALNAAEAFLFRRMTVTQNEDGEYRLFFATNRNLEQGDAPLQDRFGTEREPALKFGSYDVHFEPSIGLGMFINPTEWFQNEEIRLENVEQLQRDGFLDQLRGYVDQTPERSLFIMVHGFREAYESALRKTAFVATVLDINTPVLLFDWPGNQGSSLRGYRRAHSVAKTSGADLAATIKIIIQEVAPDKLSLLANSMGAQVVVDAFSILYQDSSLADEETELDHVILTAPDADHAQFNEQFKNQIKALSDDLIVYVSSNDRALLMSRIINRGKRLGESTLSTDQLDEAISLSRLVEPYGNQLTLVDVTPVNRTRNFHNFSLETPEFFDDLYIRLTSEEDVPRNRRIYQVKTQDERVYWVLTQGR